MDGQMNTPPTSIAAFNALQPYTIAQSSDALRQARRLFAKTLCGWTCDVLALRRKGINRAHWRIADSHHAWPKAA